MTDATADGNSRDSKTIQGEVLRIEGDRYLVTRVEWEGGAGAYRRTTQMGRNIEPVERIEARVNDQDRALSILSAPAVTDRRNDNE